MGITDPTNLKLFKIQFLYLNGDLIEQFNSSNRHRTLHGLYYSVNCSFNSWKVANSSRNGLWHRMKLHGGTRDNA